MTGVPGGCLMTSVLVSSLSDRCIWMYFVRKVYLEGFCMTAEKQALCMTGSLMTGVPEGSFNDRCTWR